MVNAVISETSVVETMTVEEHYKVVQMILKVIERITEQRMEVNVESILKFKYILRLSDRFALKFASPKQLSQILSCYNSFLASRVPPCDSFKNYSFSCWKGNEAIPSSRLSQFDSSLYLLSSTLSSPSTFFMPDTLTRQIIKKEDLLIREHYMQSINQLWSPEEWVECLLSALGPDQESQICLLALIIFFPYLRPHYHVILTKCEEAHIPSHAFLQLQEWWMLCELVWKEKKLHDFSILDALNSSIAISYQTFLKLAQLQMDDPFDLIKCITDPTFVQAILLKTLSSHCSHDIELVFAILDLNTEWNQSVYFQKYMETVLLSRNRRRIES